VARKNDRESASHAGAPNTASSSCGETWDDLVRLEVDEVEVVVPAPVGEPDHAEPTAVGREADRLAPSVDVEDEPRLAVLQPSHVDVEVDAVPAVARVREP
jgi:hypothetical protein